MSGRMGETTRLLDILNIYYNKSKDYVTLSCPFAHLPETSHRGGDRNPSFVIYPDSDFAVCYGCGTKMNLTDLFENLSNMKDKDLNLEYLDAFIDFDCILAAEEDDENWPLNDNILQFLHTDKKEEIRKGLMSRANPIDSDNIPFLVYYDDEKNMAVSAIRNADGTLVGATGRNLDTKSKFKHHHYFGVQTAKTLLGLERQDASKAIIVEGMTDFLNAYDKITKLELDYNVYATLTCSMSDWQARELVDTSKPLYMCWDQDAAANTKREASLAKVRDAYCLYDCKWGFKNKDGSIKDIGDLSYDEFHQIFK